MNLKKFALMGFACTVLAFPALAQEDPPTACDPQYMDALEARAWMEAQREITQNQNLINKPDSVLEYTCFNRFLNHLSQNPSINGVQRLFSETNHWQGPPSGLSDTSTDNALDRVVRTSMTRYLRENFGHRFMGDRLNNPANGQPIDYINRLQTRDYPAASEAVNGTGGTSQYECDRMAEVWTLARCMNFLGSRDDFDGFFDFPWYANNDPRNLPDFEDSGYAACSRVGGDPAGDISPDYQQVWQRSMTAAFNEREATYTIMDTPNSVTADPTGSAQSQHPFVDDQPYLADPVQTHLDMIRPGACGHSIPTGIQVQPTGGGTAYAEVICTNPACAQSGPGGQCTVGGAGGGGGGGGGGG